MSRPRGGYIGFNRVPAASAANSAASGVWTLREAEALRRAGTWPSAPTVPGAPTSLTATAGNAQLSLAWTAPASNGGSAITGYSVQYTPSGGSTTTVSTGSATASYILTGLTNGTSYTVAVAAINGVGTGAYSTTATETPTDVVFVAMAVVLTSGTSYTVPSGATSMKAWAIGSGSVGGLPGAAGGCAYKTWSVSGGDTVSYALGASRSSAVSASGQNTTVTYSGTTITGGGGVAAGSGSGGTFSGGDGGANGGVGATGGWGYYGQSGGAVGGNGTRAACGRFPATDVSGLFAAVALAGGTTSETCATAAAFGSGGADQKYGPARTAGLGGGGIVNSSGLSINGTASGGGAVILYFS